MTTLVFYGSLLLLAYVFAGYPLLAWARARLWPRPWRRAPIRPDVTVIIAARDEARVLPAKLESIVGQDYPADRLQVVVVSDGSTDQTAEEVRRFAGRGVELIALDQARGKAVALNAGVRAARGEILVLTDARQRLAPDAIARLIENFADPAVGAVGGRLELELGAVLVGQGLGLYGRLETALRSWEARAGSTVGLAGALYAVRYDLFRPLPEGTILDDVLVPLEVARQGHRVVIDERAVAFDLASPDPGREFARRVRTLAGNYQLCARHGWLLSPGRNPLLFELVSHKLLRLALPWLLLLLVASGLVRVPEDRCAALVLGGLGLGGLLAALSAKVRKVPLLGQLASGARAFYTVALAAAAAPWRLGQGADVLWRPLPGAAARLPRGSFHGVS